MPDKPQTIDEYLLPLPDDKRAALQRLREIIRDAAPDAVECFSYGLPAFCLYGKALVSFGAAAGHCALYPLDPALIVAFADELADYGTSKGAIRFQPAHPLPAGLVRKLVAARVAQVGRG
jgi:uncharacterized protein YdhG (YjbR/CyaY superfamily)